MGLLRTLLRWMSASSDRPKRARRPEPIRPEPIRPEPLRPLDLTSRRPPPVARAPLPIQKTTAIRIVDVKEQRGRAWVIDGDTIDIGGTRIRLAGIDAPEMDHPYGQNAKWTLVNLCKGKEVRAVFDGELSHERTVATCYLMDGRDLSAEMVKSGMALDWPKFSRGKYSGLEPSGIRKKLWRCDARQKGRMPPRLPD